MSLALAPVSPEITKISPLFVAEMAGRLVNKPVVTKPKGTATFPVVVSAGDPLTKRTAPKTSVAGIGETVVKLAPIAACLIYPKEVLKSAPVPPLTTEMAPSILAVVIVAFAISSLMIVPFAIFADVIASFLTRGKSAVPVKSPASFILPLFKVDASGVAIVT